MLEKVIFEIEKKGYSWTWRFQNKEKKEVFVLSFCPEDIAKVDNFLEAYHISVHKKGDRYTYYFGKGSTEKKRASKKDIVKAISELPKV